MSKKILYYSREHYYQTLIKEGTQWYILKTF